MKNNTRVQLEPLYIRRQEAINFLNVSISYFYDNIVKTGKINKYRMSEKVVLYKVSELKEYLENNLTIEPI